MDEPMAGTTLSGDEWEQAQYLPGASVATAPFGPDDPKKKKPAVPNTTNLGRVLTGDEWEQAQTQSGPQVKALQIPRLPTLAKPAAEATANPLSPKSKGKALAPFNIADPTTYANPVLRQIVNPALDNPIQTVVTGMALATPGVGQIVGGVMAGSMALDIARYGYQKHVEQNLSPEARAEVERDPERVTGEAAAVQAAMLGLAPLIHVGVKAMKGPSYGAGMLEAGASGVHETMADPAVAAERTAPFQGELNAAHAAYLEQGAASARGIRGESVPTTPPAGLEATASGATLTRQPKPVEGLEAPETVTPGKVTPVGTEPPSAPLDERAALDQSVRDYTAKTAAEDEAVLSKARQKAADDIAKADRFRPRRRGATVPFAQSEQGAQIIGAAAARHGMPETANPYHPDSPLATEWTQGHEAGLAASKNMAETGFASIPSDDPSTVQLPQDGAGRSGSTVDAVATAKRIVGPDKLRQLADAELARRGDPDVPEARMAAMEQVAREIASRQPTQEPIASPIADYQRLKSVIRIKRTGELIYGDPHVVAYDNAAKAGHFGPEAQALAERGDLDQSPIDEAVDRGHLTWDQLEASTDAGFALDGKFVTRQEAMDMALKAEAKLDWRDKRTNEFHTHSLHLRDEALTTPTQPSYPDGFSMGGALTDNRIPGAGEVPKTARGSDTPLPEGATPESVALANALKPSAYRGHSTDALAEAALDAQTALEHAQEAVQQAAQRGLVGERAQLDMENRGTSYSDETEGPTATAEKAVARAKSRLAQIEREFAMRGVSGDALADVIQGAKEQRAERAGMQSDDALNAHMGADDPFGESPTASRGLTSVEGTGETKTRGLSAGVQEKAVANTLTTTLGDLPEYRTVNMADQATRASDLLSSDYALARRVALGEVNAPAGLLPEAVFTAVENRAIAEGDVATIRDLATGGLTTEATTMGQRIRALAERDPDSPVSAISRVVDARSGGVENVDAQTAKLTAQIKKHLDKIKLPEDALVKLLDSLRC